MSLLSSTTSRPIAARIPVLAAPGNPVVAACRCSRIRPSCANRSSAARNPASGDASSTTCTTLSAGTLTNTARSPASVSATAPYTGITTSTARTLRSIRAVSARARAGSIPRQIGLPSRCRPSASSTAIGVPSPDRSVASTPIRRGTAVGDNPSTPSTICSGTRLQRPPGPCTVSRGARCGSEGCQAHPRNPPSISSTNPCTVRSPPMGNGLPSGASPMTSTVIVSPCSTGSAKSNAWPSSHADGTEGVTIRSRQPASMPHHPDDPASAARADTAANSGVTTPDRSAAPTDRAARSTAPQASSAAASAVHACAPPRSSAKGFNSFTAPAASPALSRNEPSVNAMRSSPGNNRRARSSQRSASPTVPASLAMSARDHAAQPGSSRQG